MQIIICLPDWQLQPEALGSRHDKFVRAEQSRERPGSEGSVGVEAGGEAHQQEHGFGKQNSNSKGNYYTELIITKFDNILSNLALDYRCHRRQSHNVICQRCLYYVTVNS